MTRSKERQSACVSRPTPQPKSRHRPPGTSTRASRSDRIRLSTCATPGFVRASFDLTPEERLESKLHDALIPRLVPEWADIGYLNTKDKPELPDIPRDYIWDKPGHADHVDEVISSGGAWEDVFDRRRVRKMWKQARKGKAHGFMDEELAESFRDATFLGNVKVSGTFMNADSAGVMIVAALLVIAMTATTFLTQRQLMSKNMPADALTGPYAQQQKMLLYVLPIVFAVGGIAFPIGVLVYWTVSNLWTMGQQFYVIRNNPAPGTPAAAAKEERDRAKAERKGLKTPAQLEEERLAAEAEAKREERAQLRQQPQRQTKAQRTNKKKKR